jgi:hypothetical protein
VQSRWFAGGGIRGGTVVGSSDKIGAYPATDPQTPEGMAATIYKIPQHLFRHTAPISEDGPIVACGAVAWPSRCRRGTGLSARVVGSRSHRLRIHRRIPSTVAGSLALLLLHTLPGRGLGAAGDVTFRAKDHTRTVIYHSPRSPGYTCWTGAWTIPEGSLMVAFTRATGPIAGRPKAPPEVLAKLNWIADYDMKGPPHADQVSQLWSRYFARRSTSVG